MYFYFELEKLNLKKNDFLNLNKTFFWVKFSMAEIVKRSFLKETFFKITVFEYFLFIFKTTIIRIVENIFLGKISHDS